MIFFQFFKTNQCLYMYIVHLQFVQIRTNTWVKRRSLRVLKERSYVFCTINVLLYFQTWLRSIDSSVCLWQTLSGTLPSKTQKISSVQGNPYLYISAAYRGGRVWWWGITYTSARYEGGYIPPVSRLHIYKFPKYCMSKKSWPNL